MAWEMSQRSAGLIPAWGEDTYPCLLTRAFLLSWQRVVSSPAGLACLPCPLSANGHDERDDGRLRLLRPVGCPWRPRKWSCVIRCSGGRGGRWLEIGFASGRCQRQRWETVVVAIQPRLYIEELGTAAIELSTNPPCVPMPDLRWTGEMAQRAGAVDDRTA